MQKNSKIIRLLEYLGALATISAKIVRTLEEYQDILWVHQLPSEDIKHCFARVWGKDSEYGDDVWIRVKKLPEPGLPDVPRSCRKWLDDESLRNPDDLPELLPTIIVEKEEEDSETGEIRRIAETLQLADFPEVQKAWDVYLEKEWLPWSDRYRRFRAVSRAYSTLFRIYQEQQKLGERYELVFCLGLLTWRAPQGHDVRRHLISAKASLEFEPHVGTFIVQPSPDGDQVDVELDMLDLEEQPPNHRELVQRGREFLQGKLWDRSAVDDHLRAIANSLADRGQGEYFGDHLEPLSTAPSAKPAVELAPALILRKRSWRGVAYAVRRIKELIEHGGGVPSVFSDLCEVVKTNSGATSSEPSYPKQPDDPEIYFPLEANEQQRLIVRRLNLHKGVLVQGPPGTGKSHTIANLICHLLATGHRVLVTAKTPRALQVLHEKLPDQIKPLCINLLGSGSEERESLSKSVSGILAKVDQRNEPEVTRRIQELIREIQKKREEKAQVDNILFSLRESETNCHYIAGGSYQGTAAQIASRLNQEARELEWLQDRIAHQAELPLSLDEIEWLCQSVVELPAEKERELELAIPDPERDLPQLEVIRSLFHRERDAAARVDSESNLLESTVGQVLSHADTETIRELAAGVAELHAAIETVRTIPNPRPWIDEALADILNDQGGVWRERLKLTKAHSGGLRNAASRVESYGVSIPARLDRAQLLADAETLKDHFENGGGTGFWKFRPKVVKERGAFMSLVKVDGLPCADLEKIQKLIEHLRVEKRLKEVWGLWPANVRRPTGPFLIQVSDIEGLTNALESMTLIYPIRERAAAQVCRVDGLGNPKWTDSSDLLALWNACEAVLDKLELSLIRAQIEEWVGRLAEQARRTGAHAVTGRICAALQSRNIDNYCRLLDQTRDLQVSVESLKRKRNMVDKLSDTAPRFGESLARSTEPHLWADRLRSLGRAWAWARAKSWLNEFLHHDSDSLERRSRRLTGDIRRDLAELASEKAWQFCFLRFAKSQGEPRRHLEAWRQAMRRLGRGTGKYAHIYRRNAEHHLNECRDAVPAWIMPLHRVYETVQPNSGIFDVVIVDEASQCGPEAIPITFLGKQTLVVGDDKQISPESVGVNLATVHSLMHDYLADFAYADSFHPETSLFDHGRIRFGNRITLQEHFRCVPEIIRFSNDLCYTDAPLIPLRQYPPERLEPLKLVHVPNGYRQGEGQRVINVPEADKLAEVVESCCRDQRYDGMTMGAIVLQGEAQARVVEEKLLSRIGAEQMAERRLICGNPYSFQGDERDVIFLSLVAAPNESIGTLTKEADRRRFNVAASRARWQMWLFHSVTAGDLSEYCFRRRFLHHFETKGGIPPSSPAPPWEELRQTAFRANRTAEKPPSPFDSWFEVDVALAIVARGYRVRPQFQFAGKRIDLIVQGSKAQLAVECYGDQWHGIDEYQKDLDRQRQLERSGLRFFIVRESMYRAASRETLEPLWSVLNAMGIMPIYWVSSTSSATPEDDSRDAEDTDAQDGSDDDVDDSCDVEDEERATEFDETESALSTRERRDTPGTIREALQLTQESLARAIIEVLRSRPNSSCKRDELTTYILQHWHIRTWGRPRKHFAKKVDGLVARMEDDGYVTVYKSKNVRVRLGWRAYPGIDMTTENAKLFD